MLWAGQTTVQMVAIPFLLYDERCSSVVDLLALWGHWLIWFLPCSRGVVHGVLPAKALPEIPRPRPLVLRLKTTRT